MYEVNLLPEVHFSLLAKLAMAGPGFWARLHELWKTLCGGSATFALQASSIGSSNWIYKYNQFSLIDY
ncbi:hypothetical protein [Herbaspirillum aquaticum]|jgi:hypothetical protein|uniref:hypothetical protein n=1 Tax=Herbaspirillum aquaticum TaxID=568783 RepID=UPI0024DE4B85|nr:hypothetical protein [Herbaspirillum aquaticum]